MSEPMGPPLARRLPGWDPFEGRFVAPAPGDASPDLVLERFLDYVGERGLELYPAQEEAILEIAAGKNVILATPTGSGKSLVASALHWKAMAEGRRSFYTCPIKALVSEKFFALCAEFGPDQVGMMTGDATVNRDAPIVCCTAEILANMALREGEGAGVDYAVMDEFHYYADRERGVAWQLPLLALPRARFLLMSATLGPTEFFEKALTELTGRETAVVRSKHRPVPLTFEYRDTPLHETVATLIARQRHPAYIVNFTQRGAAEEAQNLMSVDLCTKEEKKAITAALEGASFDSPYGKEVSRFLRHGIGLHHAGLLPRYRLLVEKLAQEGHLKIICGTDTLGVGVNIPIRSVLFTKLCKYDGEKTAILAVRDFQQISGRAGRKGFDDEGFVVAQAPEHVIENLRLEAKAGDDPVKKRRIVRKKPPEKGYVHWDKQTFERLTTSLPEPLVSRFQVTHGMVLEVLGRPQGGCAALKRLVRGSHDTPHQKRKHAKHAIALFRSLVEAGIIELRPRSEGGLRVSVDLQEDFSLNHALGLFLVHAIDTLDRASPSYALDLLTLVESIVEDPNFILQKQLDRLKTLKMQELKAAGVEYDERIAELEKMEHPKPNRDAIYELWNAFAKEHPWVGQENIRPKSLAREMFESYLSFGEYVREYGLERGEGLVLRYLSEIYKLLEQTVPDLAKTPEFDEIVAYFGTLVRGVDASLIDEWERLRDPSRRAPQKGDAEAPVLPPDVTRDERTFTALVRNAVFAFVRALATGRYDEAQALVVAEGEEAWTATRIEEAMAPFYADHALIRTDPASRGPDKTVVRKLPERGVWELEQVLCDDVGDDDGCVLMAVDLERSRAAGKPVIVLRGMRF